MKLRTFSGWLLTGLLCLACSGFSSCGEKNRSAPAGGSAEATKAPPEAGGTAWQEALWLESMGPRPVGLGGRLDILEKIADRFRGYGATVEVRRFSLPPSTPHWGGAELANLVARIGPDCRDSILLGTHWDTRAAADEDPDANRRDLPVPGFNDGTSGTAVLLDLARRWGSRKDLPFGIEFVLFDAEEGIKGTDLYFTGSKQFAAGLKPEQAGCYKAAVVFDMVADRDYRVFAEQISYSANKWLYEELYSHGDKAVFSPSPDRIIYDDHLPLLARGIPSILVIDLDYPQWHTRSDTREHCSPASLQQTADMAGRWLEARLQKSGK